MTRYAGACPVSLVEYHAGVIAQAAKVQVTREKLRQALSDLVLTDLLLDQLGPSIISQAALFLYGSTGNGKTCLAERLVRLYSDDILIPYSVEVDGQIIILYDPVVHERLDAEEEELERDPRWLRCRRPCIISGGELVPSMLDLRMDDASGTYAAPLQMKANNGVLVIDDFGRQLIPPRDLLNRWIVPLDRRVDYLMLRYGVKFQIPFELMVVFATNLEPSSLADEAFLRRIQNKILVEEVSAEVFDEILRRYSLSRKIPYEPDKAEYLRSLCLRDGRTVLRACYPGDICRILISISEYEGRAPRMTREDLERAVGLYFARG
jgi:predicted ATPase with chaperone activity